MTLDDITPPSNFLALKAIFRSMLPPGWTQRDGYPGPFIVVNGDASERYIEICNGIVDRQEGRAIPLSFLESDAVKLWWGSFLAYAKERGGTEIIWRVPIETDSHVIPERDFSTWDEVAGEHPLHPDAGKRVFMVYARLFIPKAYRCPDCVPSTTFPSQEALDKHIEAAAVRAEVGGAHLPSGDVMAESP